jgi:hypothetical protein
VLLKASIAKSESRPMDSRAVTITKQLYWETLTNLLSDEAGVKTMVEAVGPVSDDADLEAAVELANKYLAGWRPKDFGE